VRSFLGHQARLRCDRPGAAAGRRLSPAARVHFLVPHESFKVTDRLKTGASGR